MRPVEAKIQYIPPLAVYGFNIRYPFTRQGKNTHHLYISQKLSQQRLTWHKTVHIIVWMERKFQVLRKVKVEPKGSVIEITAVSKSSLVRITTETDSVINQYIDIMPVVMINIQNSNMLISLFPHLAM